MIDILQSRFSGALESKQLELVRDDILRMSLPAFSSCVANLPYYLSSDFLQKLILSRRFSCSCTLLVQSEFAAKVLASRCHDATFLSVFVQSYFEVKRCFRVSRSCFVPPPHVESTVLRLVPNPWTPEACKVDPEEYRAFLRDCFSSKNQVLSKVLCRARCCARDSAVSGYSVDCRDDYSVNCCDGHSTNYLANHSTNYHTDYPTNHNSSLTTPSLVDNTTHSININRRPWELDWKEYCTLFSS